MCAQKSDVSGICRKLPFSTSSFFSFYNVMIDFDLAAKRLVYQVTKANKDKILLFARGDDGRSLNGNCHLTQLKSFME